DFPSRRRLRAGAGKRHDLVRELSLGLCRLGWLGSLERDDFSSNRHPAPAYWWSMIFSENRYPLFGIML
ncbi:MAG: hypothetical protein ACJ8EA_18830, partial [Xanthobacteraceae bacterium]